MVLLSSIVTPFIFIGIYLIKRYNSYLRYLINNIMKVTITSIELKGPLKFFVLSMQALKIMKQLKASKYKDYKNRGFWTKHYTMTLWEQEQDIQDFARSGAHLEAMKLSSQIAKEIRTITVDAVVLPKWKEAYKLLEQGKIIKY